MALKSPAVLGHFVRCEDPIQLVCRELTRFVCGQVVGAVGFNGQQLQLPPELDPTVAGIANRCLAQNPDDRPSFAEVLRILRGLTALSTAIQEVDHD